MQMLYMLDVNARAWGHMNLACMGWMGNFGAHCQQEQQEKKNSKKKKTKEQKEKKLYDGMQC